LLLDRSLVINRRRTTRAAANYTTGMLRVLDDVEIEHVTDRAITVLSETQVPRGERMTLWAPAEGGGEVPLRVRAVQRQAVLRSTLLRHRVRFDVDADRAVGAAQLASGALDTGRIGGIVREVPIRLLDIGAGGCSIELIQIVEGAMVGYR
jgi:hypothetical protein